MHAAVEAYLPGATESEAARLRFFEGLLEIQQSHADQAASLEYTAPADDAVVERYRSGVPLFAEYPVTIDPEAFAATCGDIASYMAENAGLDQAAAQALSAYDWDSFMQKTPAKTAGSDPAAFVESALQRIDDFDVPSELPANIFMMPVVFALRAHLQPAAEQIAFLYQENVPEDDVRVRPQRGLPGVRRAFHGIMGGRIACFVGYGRTSAYAVLRPVRHPVGIRAHPLRELRQHRPKPSSLHEHRGRSRPSAASL